MINPLGPYSEEEWGEIQRQIGEPKTLEDYRKLYKIKDGRIVEFTAEEYRKFDDALTDKR